MTGRLLVTGATGLLGRAVVRAAATRYDVVAMVHERELGLDGVEELRVDVRDLGALRDTVRVVAPDIVVNAAALVRPEACEADPELAERMNVDAPATLAEELQGTGARLVHISSDSVYGAAEPPFHEATRPEPESAYALSKARSEKAVLARLPEALVLRTNFFGWSMTGTRSLAEFFVNALVAGRGVRGFTDVQFTPLYTADLAGLLLRAVEVGVSGVRNLGSRDAMSKYEFGRQIALAFGLDPDRVEPVSRTDVGLTAKRSAVLSMDSSRIAAELGVALPTIAAGIARMRDEQPPVDYLSSQNAHDGRAGATVRPVVRPMTEQTVPTTVRSST